MSEPAVAATPAAPDQRALEAHLKSARFQLGIDGGLWRVIESGWPHMLIAVTAASRENAPGEFALRFELSGYPQSAPTAAIWDIQANTLLDAALRPKGGPAGFAFRADWEGGRALYAPYDRLAIENHAGDWAPKYQRLVWHSARDLAFYLENVHRLLGRDDYVGI